MKKFLNLIVLGGSLFFTVLIFAFMAGAAVVAKSGSVVIKSDSVYSWLGDSTGTLIAFILFLLAFLAGAALLCLLVLKKEFKFDFAIAFCAGLLLLVAGILFFCGTSFIGGNGLGAGSVFSGIFAILGALGFFFYGCLAGKLIKL